MSLEQDRRRDTALRSTMQGQQEDKETADYNKELDWIKRKDTLATLK